MADLISMLAAVAGSGGGADPNFNQTVLLLHGDGTNGAQNNTFLDSSTNNFTITRNGNTTQGTFSPFSVGAGEWSNYFDGTGDTLTAADNAAFDLGSGDWTIELWANFGSVSGEKGLVSHFATPALSTGYTLRLSTGNSPSGLRLVCSSGGGTDVILQAAWSPVVSVWYHIAAVRDGGTLRLYVDGVQIGSTSIAITIGNPSTTFAVGTAQTVASSDMNGYISNVRLVKGTCLYTGGTTFTPPTAPLTAISGTSLLTCQSNRFVDNSTNAFAITRNGDVKVTPFSPFAPTAAYSAGTNGGSGYFDGTGDYLTLPSGAAFQFGTGDFSVECWFYVGATGTQYLFDARNSGQTNTWAFHVTPSTGNIVWFNGSTDWTVNTTLRINSWNHIAYVRETTTGSMFLNGSRLSTQTDSTNYSVSPTTSTVGARHTNVEPVNGYLANVRVVKGTAIYSGTTYTVPTAPLTAISNTSLLLNFTNAGIIDNTGKNNLETVGNAQIDTTTKKYGTGSMKFDGTGDYLNCRMNSELSLGSGNFTIEAWLYFTSVSGDKGIVSNFSTITGPPFQAFGINIRYASSLGGIRSVFGGGSLADAWTTSWSPSTNTWYHFAATRSGNSYRIFIDGTQIGSTETFTNATTIVNASDPSFSIGTAQTVASSDFQGYIDDLRITKGVARYDSNFPPPTAAFPNE